MRVESRVFAHGRQAFNPYPICFFEILLVCLYMYIECLQRSEECIGSPGLGTTTWVPGSNLAANASLHCLFVFEMKSHVTQADLALSILLS